MKRRKVANTSPDERGAERPRWIYGVNAVARRLAVRPSSVQAVQLLKGTSPRRAQLADAARRSGIAVHDADAEGLRRLTGSDAHQGVAALAEPYAYADLHRVLAVSAGPVLILDQIQDPHNLGALIRTAAAAGMAAIVIPRHGAAGVTPAVEKVAAGAVNDVPICQAANLHRCLLDLRDLGYWSIALDPRAAQNLFEMELPERPALILGGETGLRQLVQQTCDFQAFIPLAGGVESLNASVAGALAMYELTRRRPAPQRSPG